jgi:hypothetical protein
MPFHCTTLVRTFSLVGNMKVISEFEIYLEIGTLLLVNGF